MIIYGIVLGVFVLGYALGQKRGRKAGWSDGVSYCNKARREAIARGDLVCVNSADSTERG